MNLTKPQYTLTLSQQEIGVVHAALMELPAKSSYALINSVIAQLAAQESQQGPIVVDTEQAA